MQNRQSRDLKKIRTCIIGWKAVPGPPASQRASVWRRKQFSARSAGFPAGLPCGTQNNAQFAPSFRTRPWQSVPVRASANGQKLEFNSHCYITYIMLFCIRSWQSTGTSIGSLTIQFEPSVPARNCEPGRSACGVYPRLRDPGCAGGIPHLNTVSDNITYVPNPSPTETSEGNYRGVSDKIPQLCLAPGTLIPTQRRGETRMIERPL